MLSIQFVLSTEFVDYWLNSVHTHVHQAGRETKNQFKEVSSQNTSDEPWLSPPVIIVCTKKDITVSPH